MDLSPYQRLELFWQSKGLKNASAFADTVEGLTAAAVSAIKRRRSTPSASLMRRVQHAYPDLNPEYILWGTGSMLKDGRSLSPAEPANVEEVAAPYTATPSPIQSPAADVVAAFLSQMAERDEAHRKALKDVRREYQTMMQAQASQWQWAYDDMAKQRNEALAKVEWYEVLLNMRVPTPEQDLQLQKMRNNTPQPETKPTTNPIGWQPGQRRTELQQPQGEEVEMTHELGGMAQDFNWQQLSSQRQAPAEESALRLADAA